MRGAVLAGGQATRFGGRPKGLEEVGGRRILDRVVHAVAAATGHPPFLVANDDRAPTWCVGLEVVPDERPGFGSLGGIYTAVVRAGDEQVLCVAWDMPFVTPALLQELVASAAGYDAYLPESTGRRGMEPLCAVYGPACRVPIAEQLESGDLRVIGFHDRVRVGRHPFERVRRHGVPDELFFNVNTATDLREAKALWEQYASPRS